MKIMNAVEYNELMDWTRNYIDTKCIVRDTKMPSKIPGQHYTWMFYLRRGLFNHEFLSAVAQLFLYKMDRAIPDFNFQISGMETAATPLLAGIPLIARVYGLDINAFVVRKERKEYGLLNIVEGVPNNKPVVLLDDLCNSSTSLATAYGRIKSLEIPIAPFAFVIVNKSNAAVHSTIRQTTDMYMPDVRVISLFTLDDFGLSNPSH